MTPARIAEPGQMAPSEFIDKYQLDWGNLEESLELHRDLSDVAEWIYVHEFSRERYLRFADAWVAIGMAATVDDVASWNDHPSGSEALRALLLEVSQ